MTNPLIKSRDDFAVRHPEFPHEISGRTWGVTDTGTGPTLLLIPGTLGRGDIFWQQIDALKSRLRIIAITYPDSGGIDDWCNDINTLLDILKIRSTAILGSSLGGYLAQYVAARHPDRVTKLFAANTLHSVKGLDQRPPYSLDLIKTPIESIRNGFKSGLNQWADTHPDQFDLVELLLAEVNGRIPESELRARLAALKHGPELPAISLRTDDIITIEADDDPLIPAEMRTAVRARLSPGQARQFSWGGHFPYVVRPADYTDLIARTMGV